MLLTWNVLSFSVLLMMPTAPLCLVHTFHTCIYTCTHIHTHSYKTNTHTHTHTHTHLHFSLGFGERYVREFSDGVFRHSNNLGKEVLEKKPSRDIISEVQPRFVLSGHTHYTCLHTHNEQLKELTGMSMGMFAVFVCVWLFHPRLDRW
jgi:hypothetical protein